MHVGSMHDDVADQHASRFFVVGLSCGLGNQLLQKLVNIAGLILYEEAVTEARMRDRVRPSGNALLVPLVKSAVCQEAEECPLRNELFQVAEKVVQPAIESEFRYLV